MATSRRDPERIGRCCHLHQDKGCCDPNDCGPCCENCPTCPTLKVGRVRALHSEREFTNEYMAPYTQKMCAEDRQVWPCATIRALEED